MSKRGNFAVPTGWSGPDRRFGEVIKENLDILSGNRGDPLDRAITARDLISSGIARLPGGMTSFSGASNGLVPASDSFEELDIPPAPTNFQANGAFENILLTWDLKQYKGHAFTQIYRHTSDDIANATFLGQLSGYTGVYSDQVGESATYYYWVRAVNNNGEVGAFNSSTGTIGQTAADVTFLLNKLSNAITSSELATSLATPINDIPGIKTDVQNLEGQYSVKIDSNGHVAGFGLSNTAVDGTPTSAFIVRADKFAVIDPADTSNNLTNSPSSDVVPFFIDSGDTYIKSAMIKDASITNAKIGSLNADKITAGTLNAARLGANTIEASKLKIDGATITANSSGQIVVGTLNANVITSGTLNTSRLNIDNATITNSGGVLKIKNLGVDTLQIKDQAVTIPVGAYTAGNVYSHDSHDSSSISYATAQSVSFTSTGSPVAIFWSFLTETDGGDTDSGDQGYARIYVRIKRGSTVIQDLGYLVSTGYTGSGFKFEFLSGCFIHTGSSGAVTYRVEVGRQGHEANVSKRSMVTMELKK